MKEIELVVPNREVQVVLPSHIMCGIYSLDKTHQRVTKLNIEKILINPSFDHRRKLGEHLCLHLSFNLKLSKHVEFLHDVISNKTTGKCGKCMHMH